MRRSLIGLAAMALVAMAACSGTAATTAPTAALTAGPTAAPTAAATAAPTAAPSSGGGGQSVAIKNFTFNPATVDVKVGDKVSWANGDDQTHTVTFDDASVSSSGNVNTGGTFDTTFAAAGTFTYHCKIHPSMKGSVTVS